MVGVRGRVVAFDDESGRFVGSVKCTRYKINNANLRLASWQHRVPAEVPRMLSGRERAAVHSDLVSLTSASLSSTLFLDLSHFDSVTSALSSPAVTCAWIRVHTFLSQGFAEGRSYHA